MLPPIIFPGGHGTNRRMESALTDFPQPDSPTTATVSPSSTSKVTLSTARTVPDEVKNWVVRLRTCKSVAMIEGIQCASKSDVEFRCLIIRPFFFKFPDTGKTHESREIVKVV